MRSRAPREPAVIQARTVLRGRNRRLLPVLFSAVLAACAMGKDEPSDASSPADKDAAAVPDDVPSTDSPVAPPADVPALADVVARVDVPTTADVAVAVDVPVPVDVRAVDVPTMRDVPAPIDVPTVRDVPAPIDVPTVRDVPIVDVVRIDAGTPDAGFPDAGTPDAGFPDVGVADVGARVCPTALALGLFDTGTDGWTFDPLWRRGSGNMVAGSSTDYVSSYTQNLTSGADTDLSGCSAALLTFTVRLDDDPAWETSLDRSERLSPQCSGDGGAVWTSLTPNPWPARQSQCATTYCSGGRDSSRAFPATAQSITLPSSCLTPRARIRFQARGASAWRLQNPGWTIDSVRIN